MTSSSTNSNKIRERVMLKTQEWYPANEIEVSDGYISSKKVHFGSPLTISIQEYDLEESYYSEIDDTVLLSEDRDSNEANLVLIENIQMDQVVPDANVTADVYQSSQLHKETLVDTLQLNPINSENELFQSVEKSVKLKEPNIELESYNEFAKGIHKRLHNEILGSNEIIIVPSPKKSKDNLTEEYFLSSTPENEYQQDSFRQDIFEDIFSYIHYHVFTYALHKLHNYYLSQNVSCNELCQSLPLPSINSSEMKHNYFSSSIVNGPRTKSLSSVLKLFKNFTTIGEIHQYLMPELKESQFNPPKVLFVLNFQTEDLTQGWKSNKIKYLNLLNFTCATDDKIILTDYFPVEREDIVDEDLLKPDSIGDYLCNITASKPKRITIAEMISELMASPAKRQFQDTAMDFHQTYFKNSVFDKQIPSTTFDGLPNRQINFNVLDQINVSDNCEQQKNKNLDIEKVPVQHSMVPYSHELFINSYLEVRKPQKIRIGLSRRKSKTALHPYKK